MPHRGDARADPSDSRHDAAANGTLTMPIDLVVFDMAGTTVNDTDNAVARAVCAALRTAGVAVSEAHVDPVMGMAKPLAIRELLTEARGVAPSADEVQRVHAEFQRQMVAHYATAPGVEEIPGTTALFAELRRRGVRVALDTGFDRTIADAIIRRLGWHTGAIHDSVTSDEVPAGRPAPDMIHVLMHRAGVTNPARVAKVGDSVSDVEQGLNARCGLVVAVLGRRTAPVLQQYPGVQAVASVAELLALIEAHDSAEAEAAA